MPSRRQTLSAWFAQMNDLERNPNAAETIDLAISPGARKGHDADRLPLGDRVLAALGEDVFVLSARPGGSIERLVNLCLAQRHGYAQRWFVATGTDAVPQPLAEAWSQQGAVLWHVCLSTPDGGTCCDQFTLPFNDISDVRTVGDVGRVPGLAHWTRAQFGPWPDQSEQDFVRQLLLEPQPCDRSARSSLLRILRMQRLIGTHRLTRDPADVVCFTERRLADFAAHRVFRPMHTRWDFEPYGLCIDRDWLVAQGTRRVLYGDEKTWQRLSAADRPFFQHHGAVNERTAKGVWTDEQEWRHLGDLDLRTLHSENAYVFVPDMRTAAEVRRISRWPVVVLNE